MSRKLNKMKLKFKCIILDHDDTTVKSTRELHYPSFLNTLKTMRPEIQMSFEEFYLHCFDPGFDHLMLEKLKLNKEERIVQYNQWQNDTKGLIPEFYDGFIDLLKDYKNAGGIITVASHNDVDQIKNHYQKKAGFIPEMIFGWDMDPLKRKPAPYPVKEILKKYKLSPEEVLMIDDLKPGLIMAKHAGIKFAYAGWAADIKQIEDYMKKEADFFLKTIEDLKNLIFI